jgi:hypothetical protein
MEQRLHKDLFNSQYAFIGENAMYYSAFIDMRQTGNPDSNDNYQKAGDEQ